MPEYTVYDTTGAITQQLSVPERDLSANIPAGAQYIDGDYDAREFFIMAGRPTPRQPMEVTVSGSTITGLPVPCDARIEGQLYTITDGVLVLDANMPGPYKIRLSAVPYRDHEVTIP